mgnify:CR=1 FL=1
MPENRQFTDQALQAAARQTAEAMLSSLPSRQACAHTFSETFLQKIHLLLRKYSRKAAARRVWQRVAVVLLVMLLSASTWLTVDTHAREKLFRWTKETFENMFVYHIDGGNIEKEYCGYEPTWLPEGFVLVDSDHSDEFGFDYYYYENAETGQILVIDISFVENGAMTITPQGTGQPTVYDVNGIQADFYPEDEFSTTQALIWIDEDNATVFSVEGNISAQDILHIARGIIPSN